MLLPLLISMPCLQGKKVILVGFPGGPICVEKHIPGFVQGVGVGTPCHLHQYMHTTQTHTPHLHAAQMGLLVQKGVDKVVCVTVDSPDKVLELASREALKHSKVSD